MIQGHTRLLKDICNLRYPGVTLDRACNSSSTFLNVQLFRSFKLKFFLQSLMWEGHHKAVRKRLLHQKPKAYQAFVSEDTGVCCSFCLSDTRHPQCQ